MSAGRESEAAWTSNSCKLNTFMCAAYLVRTNSVLNLNGFMMCAAGLV